MNKLLLANDISLIRGNRPLFKHLNLNINAGDLLHLCGENGCGKTSLLQILSGLVPISKGKVKHFSDILYLGHQPGIKPLFTTRENLLFFAQLYHGLSKKEAERSIDNAMHQMDLTAFSNHRAEQLSAGQKRRIQLARLWLPCPRLWLLDEPLNALDAASANQVMKQCIDHARNGGGIIITSHQSLQHYSENITRAELSDFIDHA